MNFYSHLGHVDSGKSTIMGHLLFLTGVVDQREMHRYTMDSETIGKSSFRYAWVLDGQEEERERGVTIDVAVSSFETEHKIVTLLDAPGHRDFVPNMINGTAQADVAILVINSTKGEFETGMKVDGQTREHIILAKSLGISEIIVAVNKLDTEDWSEERYNFIHGDLKKTLNKCGYKDSRIRWLPCSGLEGVNLHETNQDLIPWYNGKCLLDLIDETSARVKDYDKPFRMIVSDMYKDKYQLGDTVSGKIQAGIVSSKDTVLVLPQKEYIKVKGIRYQDNMVNYSFAGQNVDIGIESEMQNLSYVL